MDLWNWIEITFIFYILILISPLITSGRMRFYSCYVAYAVIVPTCTLLLSPIFLLKPKDPKNLILTGNIIKYLTKFLRIEWDLRGGDRFNYRRDQYGSVVLLNHQSIFDIMGLFNIWNVLGRATVIAKRELLWILPFGLPAWLAGIIFINRKNPKTAIMKMQRASQQLFNDKIHLCVFPEGTRNKESKGSLLPFKNGAFRVAIQCQTNIIPVVFSPYYFLDIKKQIFKPGKVIISVLEPISTKGLTLNNLDELKEKVYKIMLQELNKLEEEVANLQ